MGSRDLRSGTTQEPPAGAPAPAPWPVIAKEPGTMSVRPNLVDYDGVRARSRGTTRRAGSKACPEAGVDIPEGDYAHVSTLGGCIAYIDARTAA